MTRSFITSLTFILLSFYCSGQISHDFTVFSADGLKFNLSVNGEQVNSQAKANVKMKDIEYDYVQVKIVFEDKKIPDIYRKIVQIGEPGITDSHPVSAVYKIVEKKGEYKLRFASRSAKKIQNKIILIDN